MYLDKLTTQGRVGVSRQVIITGEGWVYLNKLSTQGRGWVYLDKLSTQGRVGCI